ncbi:MAG: hypothetical protein GY796_22765 [Chloroflexi bacterium]|nr:hypothetical protein [Chloroflexota bacterium]
MNEEPEILKIEIPVEEEDVAGPPTKSQSDTVSAADKVKSGARQTTQKMWQSDARKKATDGVKKGVKVGVTAVAAKSAELMHEHMVKAADRQARQQAANLETRLKETDWKAEAGKGVSAGLSWASQKAGQLAERLKSEPDQPERDDSVEA